MERRDFIKQGTIAAIAASSGSLSPSWAATDSVKNADPIARRRLGKTDVHLSIIGMGGIVVMDSTPSASKNIVAEAVDRGINYFDVAPSYGDAQQFLAPHWRPIAKKAFSPARQVSATRQVHALHSKNLSNCSKPTTSTSINFTRSPR